MLSSYRVICKFDITGLYPKSFAELTIEDFINIHFLKWHLRGTFITVNEMRNALGIGRAQLSESVTEENFLQFLQYAYNCTTLVELTFGSYHNYKLALTDRDYIGAIMHNIDMLLARLKAELFYDRDNGEFFIRYCNDVSDVIALSHPDINRSLTEYLMIDNKEDLQRKGEILTTLYKKFEIVRNDLRGTEFDNLQSDTGFLFNKVGARHSSSDKIAEKFASLEDSDKIFWHDRTFDFFLACLSSLPYVANKDTLKSFKKS